MVVQIDSREHRSELNRVCAQFDRLGVKYFISKLPVGDYMSLDNARLVVDRKQNLTELCSNVCQDHDRFRRELQRAAENGIKVIFVCEHGEGIETLEDVIFWNNPRRTKRIKENGQWKTVETKATTGDTLYKILQTIERKYDTQFIFCGKGETGNVIKNILENGGTD